MELDINYKIAFICPFIYCSPFFMIQKSYWYMKSVDGIVTGTRIRTAGGYPTDRLTKFQRLHFQKCFLLKLDFFFI